LLAVSHPEAPVAPVPPDERLGAVRHGFAPDAARAGSGDVAPPLADIAAQLIEDVKATAATEMALLQARAALAGDGALRAAMWGAIAGGTLLVAILAIVFGAVLALAPYIGPVAATLVISAGLLAIAAFAGWRARRGAGDIRMAFGEQGTDLHWEDKP
jgi:uncharacterized membrane protein